MEQSNQSVVSVVDLLELCLNMEPKQAAQRLESSLCVSPVITAIIEGGKLIPLSLDSRGRYVAHYVRVSGEKQRSRSVRNNRLDRREDNGPTKREPYSEEEQILRGIRHCIAEQQAFRIYSDAGTTGEFPRHDPALIERLITKKAERYRDIFQRTLLDSSSVGRRTTEENDKLKQYLEDRISRMLSNMPETDDEIYQNAETISKEQSRRKKRGRPQTRAWHRQGFSQLWSDISAGLVHKVIVSDRSRLCRDADLETSFFGLMESNETRLFGLFEDLSKIDVSNPLNKGMTYFIACVNEFRLQETTGNMFRGLAGVVEAGGVIGKIPWWLKRNDKREIVEKAGASFAINRIASLYLTGLSPRAIATKLRADEVCVENKPINFNQVCKILYTEQIVGFRTHFGIRQKLFPEMITPQVFDEICQVRSGKRDEMAGLRNVRSWSNHIFTGILFCRCGRSMVNGSTTRRPITGQLVPGYCCPSGNQLEKRKPMWHGFVFEDNLKNFLREIFLYHPGILNGALAKSLSGSGNAVRNALRGLSF